MARKHGEMEEAEKSSTVPSPSPASQEGEGKQKTALQGTTDDSGYRLAILAARQAHTSCKP
jgi:hypothetical protein